MSSGLDRGPELEQIVEVPADFLTALANAGRPDDDPHTFGDFQFGDDVAQLRTVVAFDTARTAAGAGIVRHQDQVRPGQTEAGG